MSETNLTNLREAALALYNAGRWDCTALPAAEQARLWESLRDALGLPKGTATAAGVAAQDREAVTDQMVEAYASAVNEHLGSLTKSDWEAERADPDAAIRRAARIGLAAALATIGSPTQ